VHLNRHACMLAQAHTIPPTQAHTIPPTAMLLSAGCCAPGQPTTQPKWQHRSTTHSTYHPEWLLPFPTQTQPSMTVATAAAAASRARDGLPPAHHASSQHRRRHPFHHVKDSCASKKKEDTKSPRGTAGSSNTSKKAKTNRWVIGNYVCVWEGGVFEPTRPCLLYIFLAHWLCWCHSLPLAAHGRG
jgi:hypothetical protein